MILPLFSKFKTITKLQKIEKYIKLPEKTLIVLDIDYVLTHPKNPTFQMKNMLKEKSFIKREFFKLPVVARDILASSIVFTGQGSELIEPSTPNFLNSLKDRGCKIVALTAALSGELDGLSLRKQRIETLHKLGIDFSDSFPNFSDCFFETLAPNMNRYPEYYKGILFTNGENALNQKAALLQLFLNQCGYVPEKILFVDDRIANLQAIYQAFKNQRKVIPFHFQGGFKRLTPHISTQKNQENWKSLIEKAKKLSLNF